MHVLVTGAAGFIGFHLSKRLIAEGHTVVGIDNLNDYYSVQLKRDRLAQLQALPGFTFEHTDLADDAALEAVFGRNTFSHVVNLAAQAGVRYSLINPKSYVQSNLVGFGNLLECCRHGKVEHLVFASSSSVYGMNTSMPFSVHDNVDHPVSLYAASKKANELMAHTYSHLYRLPATGLRFFTVYGPWGRPDMALYLFTKPSSPGNPSRSSTKQNAPRLYLHRRHHRRRDARHGPHPPARSAWDSAKPNPSTSTAPWRIYNIGNNNTVELGTFISTLEDALARKPSATSCPCSPATWKPHGPTCPTSSRTPDSARRLP